MNVSRMQNLEPTYKSINVLLDQNIPSFILSQPRPMIGLKQPNAKESAKTKEIASFFFEALQYWSLSSKIYLNQQNIRIVEIRTLKFKTSKFRTKN